MTRDQAELFANDIALVAEGLQRFFQRTQSDPSLTGKNVVEIVHEIQATGALDSLLPHLEQLGNFVTQALVAIEANSLKH